MSGGRGPVCWSCGRGLPSVFVAEAGMIHTPTCRLCLSRSPAVRAAEENARAKVRPYLLAQLHDALTDLALERMQ